MSTIIENSLIDSVPPHLPPSDTPFPGVPLPPQPWKPPKSPYLQAFTLYIIMCISKRWGSLRGGLSPKIGGQTEKMRTFTPFPSTPSFPLFEFPNFQRWIPKLNIQMNSQIWNHDKIAPFPSPPTTHEKEASASANASFSVIFQRLFHAFPTPFSKPSSTFLPPPAPNVYKTPIKPPQTPVFTPFTASSPIYIGTKKDGHTAA